MRGGEIMPTCCKDCVRYEMCSSLMLEWYTACALGIRGRCDHYEKAEETLKECTEMCKPETDYRYDTDNVVKSNNDFIQTMKEELGNE